jgi:hypothetical protein
MAVREALERKGVIFIASAPGRGPGVALHRHGQVFSFATVPDEPPVPGKPPEVPAGQEDKQPESLEKREPHDKHGRLWHWWRDR